MKRILNFIALLPLIAYGQFLDDMTGGYINGTPITAAYQNGVQVWSANTFPLSTANGFVASYWAEDLSTGAVATWADKIGSNNATQGTGTAQPSCINTDSDGKKSVKFDGTSDFLSITEVAALDFTPGDPISFVAVTGEAAWAIDGFILQKGNTTSSETGQEYGFYCSGASGLRGNVYGNDGSTTVSKTASGVDVWIVVSDGSTFDVYKNGSVVISSVAVGTTNVSSNIFIGSRVGTGKWFSGSIRAIGIADSELSAGIISEISAYDW